jgi:hypothetical protein
VLNDPANTYIYIYIYIYTYIGMCLTTQQVYIYIHRHVLNDPAMLRQTMEMMRNPNAMNQAMRSQELAMSQVENMPGGFNALRRMYEDVRTML